MLLDLAQFSPVIWLEDVPKIQLLHFILGGREGFVTHTFKLALSDSFVIMDATALGSA
jgi:hypothetical protein